MNKFGLLLFAVVVCGCMETEADDTGVASQAVTTAPTFQAAGALASGTGSISVSWPTEVTDDVGLLVIETANQSVSAPAGWLAVANSPQGTGTAGSSTATRLTVFYKRALSASEGVVLLPDAGDHIVGQILTFRGCVNTGFPWDTTAGNVVSTTSTIVSMPSVTTAVDNTLVVGIVANRTDTTSSQTSGYTNSGLTNLIEVSDRNVTAGNGGGFGVVTGELAVAGDSLHTVAVLATASVQGRLTIALKP